MKIMFYDEGISKGRGDPRNLVPQPTNQDTCKKDETLEWEMGVSNIDSLPDNDGTTIYSEDRGWYVHLSKEEIVHLFESLMFGEWIEPETMG